ncbi:MAG TPA: N-acetylmuramoyl-L-alanine amidase [Verrucomicrobiae bacterium]|nr:N-acetylmuramoyl-L-alanine amidase [Verrucomicrobiae bacterium]
MRSLLSSSVLAWALLVAQACFCIPAARSAEEVRIAGREYTRLSDWARRNNFSVRWTKKDDSLELANAERRIVLQIHSPEAELDGVEVRLLFPLVQQGDTVWISSMDVKSTFDPLLFPPRLRNGAQLRTICLDPGHGGKDPGNQVGGTQEKTLALLLSQELQSQLKRAGWKVSLTRTRDTFVELPERPDIARRRKADLFVSIHFNSTASAGGSVKGAEVYCLTPAGAPSTNAGGEGGGAGWFPGNRFNDENILLAYQVQKNLTRKAQIDDRGVHRARFWVLRDAVTPAVLIEAGFLSNPAECRKILSPVYRRQLASAIVQGLCAYKATMERRL